jgi:hypothetical protein
MGLLILAAALPAHAVVIFADGAVHNVTSPISDDDGVGYISSGQTPSVNVLRGGTVTGTDQLAPAGGVTALSLGSGGLVNVSGGSVTGGNIQPGAAGIAAGVYQSGGQFNLNSGTITGGNINGSGIIYAVELGGGRFTMNGGQVSPGGGGIAIQVNTSGLAEIFGGTISSGSPFFAAISGGGGRANIFGGNIDGPLRADSPGSLIMVAGTSFNFPFGPISATSGTLTGTLLDGTPINAEFHRGNSAQIVLVPEPASGLMLVALAGGGVAGRRRKSTAGMVRRGHPTSFVTR